MKKERMYKINFILMRCLGKKRKNPYSLKALTDKEVKELAKDVGIPEKEINEFIPKFRKAMRVYY